MNPPPLTLNPTDRVPAVATHGWFCPARITNSLHKMNDTETEEILDDLTNEQCAAMKRLIVTGKLDFEIHRTNPGTWSHDIGISVDHEEFMAATKKESRQSSANDRTISDLIKERDRAEEWADKLASAIADFTGCDIGEHSNMNCPWEEALDAISSYRQNDREETRRG